MHTLGGEPGNEATNLMCVATGIIHAVGYHVVLPGLHILVFICNCEVNHATFRSD